MNTRITVLYICLLLFMRAFASTPAAIGSDSTINTSVDTTSFDSSVIQPLDSIQIQTIADRKLLSLIESDTTDTILPAIKLLRLLERSDSIKALSVTEIPVNPLFMPIIFKGQMSTPMPQLIVHNDKEINSYELSANAQWLQKEMQAQKSRAMAQNYVIVNYPQLIRYNLDNLPEVPKQYVIVNNPAKQILSIEEKPLVIKNDVGTEKIKIKRWIVGFQSAIQFSQVYISDNWYQGGNSNVNLLSDQQLSIKYNDVKDKRILFENLIQWRLNLNSAPEDTLRSVRISEDLFQINSKFGLKAYNNWYYTATMNFKTQFLTSYAVNTNDKTASFLSPSELNVGLGMSYQYKNDKKRFETSISLSPLSYNLQFLIDNDLDPEKFGIKSGKSSSQYGSSLDARMKWQLSRNIAWNCRLFYFTNYEHVQGDLENTFDFILNRFFSTKIFVHLRYDDARTLDKDLGHFQIKELLSFGFNYRF